METLLKDQGGVQGWILVLRHKPDQTKVVFFPLKALFLAALGK